MEGSGQLYTKAPLPLVGEPQYPLNRRLGRDPEPVWMLCERTIIILTILQLTFISQSENENYQQPKITKY